MSWEYIKTVIRFVVVGLATTAISYVSFSTMIKSGAYYEVASIGSWACASVLGFFLHRSITFKFRREESGLGRFSVFAIGSIAQLLVGMAGYWLLIGVIGLGSDAAFLLNLIVTTTFSFLFMRFVVFRVAASRSAFNTNES